MNMIIWGLRFLIPLTVLFTLGYYVRGFSALTIPWLIILAVLIVLGDWLVHWFVKKDIGSLGTWTITFLVSLTVISLATLGIKGGNVPLGAAILAALLIAVLDNLIIRQPMKEST